jgi:hypothetical protein
MAQEELARITASAPRRVIGVGAMMGLGALLLYMGLATPGMHFAWKGTLSVLGVGTLWAAQVMWQATGHVLILTEEALTDSDGTVVASLDNIAKVDRSVFAMKPSNGFLISLKTSDTLIWRPGLWWRMGRRVAIGGVTSGGQTRPVADIMTLLLTERDGDDA